MAWDQVTFGWVLGAFAFVFWEPYGFSKSMKREYESKRTNLPAFPNVPTWAFPIIWYILKSCLVAAIVVFQEFTVDTTHWAWITVSSMLFANLVVAKTWTFFYKQRMYGVALGIAIGLFLTGLAILICLGIGKDNMSDVWFVPLILTAPYVTWLMVACLLSYSLLRVPHAHSKPGFEEVPAAEQSGMMAQIRMSRKIDHMPTKSQ